MTLEECISFASLKHQGQIYKGFDWPFQDEPYICHPLRVMLRLSQMESANELMKIAVLHDVLEDTDTTEEELKNNGLSPIVIQAVIDLSRNKKTEKYPRYIERINNSSWQVRCVKIEDLRENISRKPTPKLYDRYAEALKVLTGKAC